MYSLLYGTSDFHDFHDLYCLAKARPFIPFKPGLHSFHFIHLKIFIHGILPGTKSDLSRSRVKVVGFLRQNSLILSELFLHMERSKNQEKNIS